MGAVTVNIVKKSVGSYVPAGKCVLADITFSSSYAAGGDTFTPGLFGMSKVDAIVDCGAAVASATTGYVIAPDLTNSKIRLLGGAASGAALTETGTAGQTGTVARCLVYGDNPHV
jgi:hypothetical protein